MEILRPLRLRYFSPEELLRLFCFEDAGSDSTFRWPEGVSIKTKYRLIGNSVNVLVVSALIECLYHRYGFRSVGKLRAIENADRTRLISLSLEPPPYPFATHWQWNELAPSFGLPVDLTMAAIDSSIMLSFSLHETTAEAAWWCILAQFTVDKRLESLSRHAKRRLWN